MVLTFFDVDLMFFDVDLSFYVVDLTFAPTFHRERTVRTCSLNGSLYSFARTFLSTGQRTCKIWNGRVVEPYKVAEGKGWMGIQLSMVPSKSDYSSTCMSFLAKRFSESALSCMSTLATVASSPR